MTAIRPLEIPGYQVMDYLGSGARSTIWKIRNRRTGRVYALKRVVKRHPSDQRFFRQAENEFAIASQLDHPVLRKCIEFRRRRKWLCTCEIHTIMEYCEGVSVQQSRPEDVDRVLEIFVEVAGALHYIHCKGFLHSDIKPNNIIIAPDDTVKVIDMGQSCRIGAVKGRIQGTPDFIAPEQVYRNPLTVQTDAYNFGASLYWSLTGEPINTVIARGEGVQLKKELKLRPLNEVNPKVPAALATLVADCVEYQPSRRPGNIDIVKTKMELIRKQISRNQGGAS